MKDALDRIIEVGDFVLSGAYRREDDYLPIAYISKIHKKMVTVQTPGLEGNKWSGWKNSYSKQLVIVPNNSTRITASMVKGRDKYLKSLKTGKKLGKVDQRLKNLLQGS